MPVWVVQGGEIVVVVHLSNCAELHKTRQDKKLIPPTVLPQNLTAGKVVKKLPAGSLAHRKSTPVKWKPAPHL